MWCLRGQLGIKRDTTAAAVEVCVAVLMILDQIWQVRYQTTKLLYCKCKEMPVHYSGTTSYRTRSVEAGFCIAF